MAKARATAKAKAKHVSKPCNGPAAAEPKRATHEEASAAAQLCTKCLSCQDGSKGFRACVGKRFEIQRKR
eukprot:1052951-Pyramimonas_sp.AAC.1